MHRVRRERLNQPANIYKLKPEFNSSYTLSASAMFGTFAKLKSGDTGARSRCVALAQPRPSSWTQRTNTQQLGDAAAAAAAAVCIWVVEFGAMRCCVLNLEPVTSKLIDMK